MENLWFFLASSGPLFCCVFVRLKLFATQTRLNAGHESPWNNQHGFQLVFWYWSRPSLQQIKLRISLLRGSSINKTVDQHYLQGPFQLHKKNKIYLQKDRWQKKKRRRCVYEVMSSLYRSIMATNCLRTSCARRSERTWMKLSCAHGLENLAAFQPL